MEELLLLAGGKKQLIKYAVIIIAVIAVIVTAIVLWKKFKSNIEDGITEKQLEHINSLEIDDTQISIPQTEMNNLVAKLKTAFGKYGWGTDEQIVYDVFECINNRDELLSLITAFGVHESHTLTEWMNKELNYKELAHVQEILSSKGIVYTF